MEKNGACQTSRASYVLQKAQSPTCLKHLLLKEYLSEIANQACIRLALDLLNWVIVHRLGTILCELRLHFCAVSTRNLMKQYTLFCSIVMKCSISIVSNRIADFEPILLLVFARRSIAHLLARLFSLFYQIPKYGVLSQGKACCPSHPIQ